MKVLFDGPTSFTSLSDKQIEKAIKDSGLNVTDVLTNGDTSGVPGSVQNWAQTKGIKHAGWPTPGTSTTNPSWLKTLVKAAEAVIVFKPGGIDGSSPSVVEEEAGKVGKPLHIVPVEST